MAVYFLIEFYEGSNKGVSIWDENFKNIENIFNFAEEQIKTNANNVVTEAFYLSQKLSIDFVFVRIDFMVYKDKLWFEELTFTPYAGFNKFQNRKTDLMLGELINLRR